MERKVYVTAQFNSIDKLGLGDVDDRSKGDAEGEKSTFLRNNGIYQVFMHCNNMLITEKSLLICGGSYKCRTDFSLFCSIAIMLKINI